MRFHVVALPHTQVTKEYAGCAFTEKVRRFVMMMKAQGHTVYLYAGEQSEGVKDELTTQTEIESIAAPVYVAPAEAESEEVIEVQ